MVALHDLCWNLLFSCQMICKQYIILNHMFDAEVILSLEPITETWKELISLTKNPATDPDPDGDISAYNLCHFYYRQ